MTAISTERYTCFQLVGSSPATSVQLMRLAHRARTRRTWSSADSCPRPRARSRPARHTAGTSTRRRAYTKKTATPRAARTRTGAARACRSPARGAGSWSTDRAHSCGAAARPPGRDGGAPRRSAPRHRQSRAAFRSDSGYAEGVFRSRPPAGRGMVAPPSSQKSGAGCLGLQPAATPRHGTRPPPGPAGPPIAGALPARAAASGAVLGPQPIDPPLGNVSTL